MRTASLIWLCAVVLAESASAADVVNLEPTARWRLDFPELGRTLGSLASQETHPTQMTVWLPANYSKTGRFPLFVMLDGGDGGFGDRLPLRPGTIGSNDFIYVNLPLFKRSYAGTNDSVVVMMEDYETMSHAYRVMLQKLFDTVPNITPERSAFGGFSNGAHATGVLLARRDPFLLEHFRSFFLIEGGFGSVAASVAAPGVAPELKRARMLLMYGDTPLPGHNPTCSRMYECLGRGCVLSAEENRFDLSLVVMRGYGHELPSEYETLLGMWIRGEALPDQKRSSGG